jgi:predicted amidophosphoribosyltransferase
MPLIEQLIALAVPPRCGVCGAPGGHANEVLCAACRRGLPWLVQPRCPRCALPLPHGRGRCPAAGAAFGAAWAAVAYEGRARDALLALKFSAARPLAGVMAAQIAAGAPLRRQATLVAVPPHPQRRRARGFDPAELIATALARRSGLPLARMLRRGRGRSRQLGASRAARRDPANLDFSCRGPAPADVVLVDDVHTTGATLNACAQALRHADCRRITVVTWARALDDRPC